MEIFLHVIPSYKVIRQLKKLPLYKLRIFSVVLIIWNLSVFRRELQLKVGQMCTAYCIFVTWQCNRVVTWHVGWGLLILVTTLLSLWALRLVKAKIEYFWFVMWQHHRSVTWLFGWVFVILRYHPTKFGVHKPCESGDITFFICHVNTILNCHVTFCLGSPHPKFRLTSENKIFWKYYRKIILRVAWSKYLRNIYISRIFRKNVFVFRGL